MRAEESLGLNCAWYADILLTLTTDDARERGHSGGCRGPIQAAHQ